MKARLLLASMGFMAITLFALAQQSTTQPNKAGTGPDAGDIITSEQQLARMFADFQDALLRLKQRLARGTPEEKRRAEVLDKVIDECKNLAINQEFSKMIEILRVAKFTTTTGALQAKEQSNLLADRLRKIYDMLQDRSLDLSKDREKLADIVKQIQKAIDAQRAAQGQTDRNKTDKDELRQIQEGVNKKTNEIGKSIDQYLKKDGKAGEAANLKGENKDPGKNEGSKGESKNDGREQKETKRGETKQEGPDAKGAKGEAKPGQDPKAGEGKKSDAKPGDKSGKEGDAKPGSKDDKNAGKGQEGSAKPNAGEKSPMKGEGKEGNAKAGGDKKDGPQGAAKPGEDKKAGEKAQGKPDTQAKPGQPDAKQGGAKEAKAGGKEAAQAKPGDAKPSDKGGEAKQGDAKPGDSKSGQGQAKDGGAPPMPGQQAQQPQQKGGDQPQANNPPGGDKQDQEVQKTKQKIEEAGYEQKAATDNIKKGDNKQASDKQGDAINKLEDAKKRLEKLLQQLREEEIERVLAALENRCVKMLEMQKQVLVGTEETDRSILKNADKKPSRDNKLAALGLADKQKEIVQECNKCITILESEGSAVAFPEVFQQIRQDMIHVQKRLELTDVAGVTQGIERDIIDTLKEMIDALKKAQEDNKDSKPGKSGKAGKGGQGDKKLLELIQELKMVRSLQKRVNDRTVDYAKRFPGQEQTRDPQTVTELRNLAERQLRIQEIVSRIAKGDNK